MPQPAVTLVAAIARNRVIGRDGGMPWHLPADLSHFKSVTLNHPVIMGRRTFESIGKPLPKRRNIVVSRGAPDLPDGVVGADSLEAALQQAGTGPVMVIGGGEIYRRAMARATRMELTLIDADIDGDAHFPEWSGDDWQLVAMTARPPDERNPFRLVFCSFRRVEEDD